MRFSFKSFAIGFACAALSMGAVSYVNAAGDATIKSCANKKTGAMRYISKGKCKKTEKLLSWNQMGPQGLQGAAGTNGADGAKGVDGAKGAAGATGTNGQNLFLMNADGSTVGPLLQVTASSASVLVGEFIWDIAKQNGHLSSPFDTGSYFRDAACTIPFGLTYNSVGIVANPQSVAIDYGANSLFDSSDKVYKAVGLGLTFSSQPSIYVATYSGCTTMPSGGKSYKDADGGSLFELVEISTRPILVLPLTVISK